MGALNIVITGISMNKYIGNAIMEDNKEVKILKRKKVGQTRSGTGDIFASIIAADAVNGVSLYDSVKKASSFIKECIKITEEYETPKEEGVCFEEIIHQLK